jgi:hypothetical protein
MKKAKISVTKSYRIELEADDGRPVVRTGCEMVSEWNGFIEFKTKMREKIIVAKHEPLGGMLADLLGESEGWEADVVALPKGILEEPLYAQGPKQEGA